LLISHYSLGISREDKNCAESLGASLGARVISRTVSLVHRRRRAPLVQESNTREERELRFAEGEEMRLRSPEAKHEIRRAC